MSKLTTEERNALPDDAFALPGRRYPIPDATHARDALARASEMLHRGTLTQEEYETIHTKAEEVLRREHVTCLLRAGDTLWPESPERGIKAG